MKWTWWHLLFRIIWKKRIKWYFLTGDFGSHSTFINIFVPLYIFLTIPAYDLEESMWIVNFPGSGKHWAIEKKRHKNTEIIVHDFLALRRKAGDILMVFWRFYHFLFTKLFPRYFHDFFYWQIFFRSDFLLHLNQWAKIKSIQNNLLLDINLFQTKSNFVCIS